jgi:hypothetical protein
MAGSAARQENLSSDVGSVKICLEMSVRQSGGRPTFSP